MSTPGDRIRKAAEEARRRKEQQDAKAREEEATREKLRQDLMRRADQMAHKFLAGAQEMRQQSGYSVHLHLERHEPQKLDPGFLLTIGKPKRGIRATLAQDGQWRVGVNSATRGTRETRYHDDSHLEQARDELLELLMTEAAVAVAAEEEAPAEDRKEAIA